MASIQIRLQIKCWAFLLPIHSCAYPGLGLGRFSLQSIKISPFYELGNIPILKWIFSRFPTKSKSWSRCHYQTLSDQYWLKKPWLCHFLKQYRISEHLKWNRVLPFSAVKETICLTNANYKFHLKNPMKKARLGFWSWDGSRDVMDGVNCHKSPIHPILTLAVRGRIGENYRCLPLVRVARIFCISSPSSSSECVLRLYLTFDINP